MSRLEIAQTSSKAGIIHRFKMRTLRLFLLCTFILIALKPTQAASDFSCRVFDDTSGTPDTRFREEIGVEYSVETFLAASELVLETFNQSNCGERGYSMVLAIVEGFAANGYPFTIATNNGSQFWVNEDYLQAYEGDVKAEFTGILYHESAHIWQWTGNDTATIDLITGIADYIRLKARWPSKYWLPRRSGSRWNDGYAMTAYFLEFCNKKRHGFVSDPNTMMENLYFDAFFVISLWMNCGRSISCHSMRLLSLHQHLHPSMAY
ncbi:hypothetical protein BT93_I0841 [Corymbia citriodora subsp. variegata]|nr:hypothetical protein BT93_I0841 [Corymbia citriodora subsp. variegata]